jgi:apolipoprotein N-acyltransferase
MASSIVQMTAATETTAIPQTLPLSSTPRMLPITLPALLSAALLWASFFPLAWNWLAFVALVPLLVLVRRPMGRWSVFFASWLAGLAFFWPALQWMRVADLRMYVTWAGLATYCALFFPLAIFLMRAVDRWTRLPLTITLPVVWVAVEFLRSNLGGGLYSLITGSYQHDIIGGFGWYCLGYSQHDSLALIQIADIAGVFGVSFLLCMVNGLVFEALMLSPWLRQQFLGPAVPARSSLRSLLVQTLTVAALMASTLSYGAWQLNREVMTPGPRLALLQGSVDQRIRNASSQGNPSAVTLLRSEYELLTNLAARSPHDLVVWPETSIPEYWMESGEGHPTAVSQNLAQDCAKQSGSAVLLGLSSFVRQPGESVELPDGRRIPRYRHYNSAVLVGSNGGYLGRYDKMHRVPFGEYIPFKDTFPILNILSPYDSDYSIRPGEQFTRFPLGKWHFGVMICYEDTVSELGRTYARADGEHAPVDFLVNTSNDGWFDGTSEHDEHLAICRFRAIECRKSVARAVNMGISGVIDGNGRVQVPVPLPRLPGTSEELCGCEAVSGLPSLPVSEWWHLKKTAFLLLATMPIDSRASFYAHYGDWLPALCWLLLAGLILNASFSLLRGKGAPVGVNP